MAQSTLASRIHVFPSIWLLVRPVGHREEMCVTASPSGSPNGEPSNHTAELEQIRIVYESPTTELSTHYPLDSGVAPFQQSILPRLMQQNLPNRTQYHRHAPEDKDNVVRVSVTLHSYTAMSHTMILCLCAQLWFQISRERQWEKCHSFKLC